MLDLVKIGKVYKMLSEGVMGPSQDNNFDEDKFWESITRLPKFKSSCIRVSFIKNPIIWIAHKILICTLLGNKESHGKITRAEFYILWGIMHKKKINIASYFIGHLSKVASTKKEYINIGGFITFITLMIKHDFEGCVLAVGRTWIDKLSITYMEIIEEKKG